MVPLIRIRHWMELRASCAYHFGTEKSASEFPTKWYSLWSGVGLNRKVLSNLMVCWPCITVYQYSETNVMHFPFNLLRMSVGRGTVAVSRQPCQGQLTLYAHNIPNVICAAPPEDEQVMLETCRGLWFSINWMKSASRWFHYAVILSNYFKGSSSPRVMGVLRQKTYFLPFPSPLTTIWWVIFL
jgi:hypothetical protein